MRSTIEELYYGNINPGDRTICRGSEYAHLINLVSKNEEDLAVTLTDAQKETLINSRTAYRKCMVSTR